MASKQTSPWLEGFYPPEMEVFDEWQEDWSIGPHSEPNWVWFNGNNYTEAEAREILKSKPWGTRADELKGEDGKE